MTVILLYLDNNEKENLAHSDSFNWLFLFGIFIQRVFVYKCEIYRCGELTTDRCCCDDHTGQLYCKEQNLLSNMLFMHNC